MQNIISFLMKDKVAESKSLQKYRIKFIYMVGSFLTFLLFGMSIFRFLNENYLVCVVDFSIGLSIVYMIYLIKKDIKYLPIVIQVYLTIFFLFTFFLIFSVDYEIKIILPYLFITAALFLQGKKIGFIWLITIILTLVALSLIPHVNFQYHGLTTIMMILLLISQYLILILYANQQEENIINLSNLNNILEQKIEARVAELALLNSTLEDKVEEQVRVVKDSLHSLKIMFDSTIMSIVVHDETGIIEVNKVAETMFGYTREQLLGQSVLSLVHLDDHSLVKLKMSKFSSDPYEIRVLGYEKIVPILIGGTNLILNGKQVRVASMFDLTEFKQKDSLLQQQSRQAAMGEMIGNIAHQWRQPLNALGLVLQNIHFENQIGTLDDDFIEHSVEKGTKLIQTMSKTIDDFRNFFKQNKLKERFEISEVINNMIDLVGASYQNNGILIEVALDDTLEIDGYSGEFSQVILNIMSNAKDALIENPILDKKVVIASYRESNNVIIEISDNAGGIPENVINNIFDPYFTTKEEGKGTGIGLYMSKTIIETNINGKISVKNSDDGAVFTIILDNCLEDK